MCHKEPKVVLSVYTVQKNLVIFVQSRQVNLFIVNCLLKNKFNIYVLYFLYILVNTVSQIFMQRKEYNLIKVYNKLLVKFKLN